MLINTDKLVGRSVLILFSRYPHFTSDEHQLVMRSMDNNSGIKLIIIPLLDSMLVSGRKENALKAGS